jgi:BirA family transcriptional regulator, biotin operon repressor / biotin---[acetyl-CoA-carboxylase] ligase
MKIDYIHLSTISSTNDFAKENQDKFHAENLTVISADLQTQGRGQLGKSWISFAQNKSLTASFCFFIEKRDDLSTLGIVMAISLKKVFFSLGVDASIKWPNDLLIQEKKIAGILTEIQWPFVVIGVGINIFLDQELLQAIDQPATSLIEHSGKTIAPLQLTYLIASQFLEDLHHFKQSGIQSIAPSFL